MRTRVPGSTTVQEQQSDSRRLVLAERGCRSGTTGTFPPPPPIKPSQAVICRGLTFPSPLNGIATADVHKSAVFTEIGACPIAATELYPHPVEAVQGSTAWARRVATLRRRRISSPRRDTRVTGPRRRSSTSSWPSTIRGFGTGARPRVGPCRATWELSSKPISGAACPSTAFCGSSAMPARPRSSWHSHVVCSRRLCGVLNRVFAVCRLPPRIHSR